MELREFFQKHPRAALAFSGGVDSAYLFWAALDAGADVTAYFVNSVFQPAFALADARRLAGELGGRLRVLEEDVLADPAIAANGPLRCYHCKKRIFTAVARAAQADGYDLLLDGTNASDDEGDRPGMRALAELSVASPLRACGLTKADVRAGSRAAGLFTWDKPSYSCLATRVTTDEPLTAETLSRVERAEAYLLALGFSDLRVRVRDGAARLQFRESQLPLAREKSDDIFREMKKYFEFVTPDFEVRP